MPATEWVRRRIMARRPRTLRGRLSGRDAQPKTLAAVHRDELNDPIQVQKYAREAPVSRDARRGETGRKLSSAERRLMATSGKNQ